MTCEELEQRVANWENLHTEFKLEAIHPDDLSAALVGFANAEGGDLIIGVSNDKQIAGVADTDRLAQYVDRVAFNNSRPPMTDRCWYFTTSRTVGPPRPAGTFKVFISHGKNMAIVEQVKDILGLYDIDYEAAVEEERPPYRFRRRWDCCRSGTESRRRRARASSSRWPLISTGTLTCRTSISAGRSITCAAFSMAVADTSSTGICGSR